MKIDEHDVGRYRRQDQKGNHDKDKNRKWLPMMTMLLIIVALFGAWRMGIFGSSNQSATEIPVDGNSPPTVNTQNQEELLRQAIAGDISNFATSIQDLSDKVNFLIGANQRDNQQFKKVSSDLQQIRNGLGGLDQRITAIESNINKLTPNLGKVDALTAGIENLDSRIQADITKITENNIEITENFEKISQDLINLDALSRNQAQSIKELENYLNTINSRVTNLER